ncbi:TIGR01457 family HAD-type hydrolase [Gorillibacterium massiliense]|uniref:TIGR01457 family HAD-type hydrolase n=1 Tax=Gorillibacterium massiliense TaxID=1280390 RepID=UPI0004B66D74|nr:TIGR01457 family HAD-type hydrolase [Gorillibacterium massiliense]
MTGFLIDLDGTMYSGTRPLEHAAEFIETLQKRNIPYLFVTNNSSRRPEEVAEHLQRITRIQASHEDVYTSSQTAARFIADQNQGKRVYMIGERGLELALKEAGLELIKEGDGDIPDFVVSGIDREFTYSKLETAVGYILSGARYILTNPDHLLPNERGYSPGAGSLGGAIRTATQTEPVIIGKPSPIIMEYAIEKMGLPAKDIWVVGDNLRTDICGGAAAGCRTALVRTGVAATHDIDAAVHQLGIKPDQICDHLMELTRLLP